MSQSAHNKVTIEWVGGNNMTRICAMLCGFALLFGLVDNVLANRSCVWVPEGNGYRYGICTDSGGSFCVRCPVDSNVCVMVKSPCYDQPPQKGALSNRADCGVVDPNRTEPFPPNHEFCPGNLVCMTNFCGGGMGCPYVCCPRGLPYLNHCDCKCYADSNFDCHSYSYCREKLLQ